jgi:hypothetical protein
VSPHLEAMVRVGRGIQHSERLRKFFTRYVISPNKCNNALSPINSVPAPLPPTPRTHVFFSTLFSAATVSLRPLTFLSRSFFPTVTCKKTTCAAYTGYTVGKGPNLACLLKVAVRAVGCSVKVSKKHISTIQALNT